ncbi:hypothetical protein MIND_00933000 [Mycena indigotica]|uniref:Uncharacterized protein n=1 Tax=Mycena indigotica TaxID=2126181 RepID=A0A8H6SDL5_9AGAR|nr:uncharacterized protein MIND_00933000 [Mycena indigotica]KAF7297007.1 hypothetical protein MIND_00933000 [Mycena indigotica]
MPKAFKRKVYKPPPNTFFAYVHNPWPYLDAPRPAASASNANRGRGSGRAWGPAQRANATLAWVCIMARDLCGVQLEKEDMVLFRKGTSDDVIVQMEAPAGTDLAAFEALLGGHHRADFERGDPKEGDDVFSVVYRYDYALYNAPGQSGWEEVHATADVSFAPTKLPKDFSIRRDGAYPAPRPVPKLHAVRPKDVAALPGRLVLGHKDCVYVQPGPAAGQLQEPAPVLESAVVERAPTPSPTPPPPQLPPPRSEHAFVPYESILPTSGRPAPPAPNTADTVETSAAAPRSSKLGKIDPDDEDAAAQAYLHGEPPDVRVKQEHHEFDDEEAQGGLGGIAELVQRERERRQRGLNGDGTGPSAVPGTASAPGVHVKQEPQDACLPINAEPEPADPGQLEAMARVKPEPFEPTLRLPVQPQPQQQDRAVDRNNRDAYTRTEIDKPVGVKPEPVAVRIPPAPAARLSQRMDEDVGTKREAIPATVPAAPAAGGVSPRTVSVSASARVKRENLDQTMEVDDFLRDATTTVVKREPVSVRIPPASASAQVKRENVVHRMEVDSPRPGAGAGRRSPPGDGTTVKSETTSAPIPPAAERYTLVELPQTPEQRRAARLYGVHAASYRSVPVPPVSGSSSHNTAVGRVNPEAVVKPEPQEPVVPIETEAPRLERRTRFRNRGFDPFAGFGDAPGPGVKKEEEDMGQVARPDIGRRRIKTEDDGTQDRDRYRPQPPLAYPAFAYAFPGAPQAYPGPPRGVKREREEDEHGLGLGLGLGRGAQGGRYAARYGRAAGDAYR